MTTPKLCKGWVSNANHYIPENDVEITFGATMIQLPPPGYVVDSEGKVLAMPKDGEAMLANGEVVTAEQICNRWTREYGSGLDAMKKIFTASKPPVWCKPECGYITTGDGGKTWYCDLGPVLVPDSWKACPKCLAARPEEAK